MKAIRGSAHPSMGVKLLNRDHDDLEEIFEEILLKSAGGSFNSQIQAMLRKLAKRMRLHFSLEESVMSASHYPGIDKHCRKHRWLMDQMAVLATRDGRQALERNVHLLNLLGSWHHRHLGEADLNYDLWLNAGAEHHGHPAAPAVKIDPPKRLH